MKPAAVGSFVALFTSALLIGAASAASIDSAYDMQRLLNEPHPLAHEYGTRWNPAPVQPMTPQPPATYPPPPRPVIAPPPVAIPPPVMLPAAPAAPAAPPQATPPPPAAAAPAITPNLAIDDPGWPKAPAAAPVPMPAAVAPPPKAATVQPPPPPPPPPVRTRQRSTVRVGVPAPRAQPSGAGFLSEIRVGALYHDQGPFSRNKEEGGDANVELLFTSPDFMRIVWSPRPHIGLDMNTKGDTSSAYLGLSWEWEFWRFMFGGFSLGGAVHNGKITNAPVDRKELGCRVLFRESIELGVRFAKRHSISGFLDHISNAKLCSTNEGLENAGIRYGYKF